MKGFAKISVLAAGFLLTGMAVDSLAQSNSTRNTPAKTRAAAPTTRKSGLDWDKIIREQRLRGYAVLFDAKGNPYRVPLKGASPRANSSAGKSTDNHQRAARSRVPIRNAR